jgi:hypothetical protein
MSDLQIIKVENATLEELKKLGIKGTYDVIIQRLIRSWIKGGNIMAEEVKKEAFVKRNREEVHKQIKRKIEREALEEK